MLIFGKVRSYVKIGTPNDFVSGLLVVKNVNRELFFCLKKGHDKLDLMAEIKDIINSKILAQKPGEISFEHVRKKYTFELEVDVDEQKFVECVRVSFSFKRDLKADEFAYEGEFYKGLFGTSYTPTETIILQNMLKGPGWIGVHDYQIIPSDKKTSWCFLELAIEDCKSFSRIKIPRSLFDQFPTPKMRSLFINLKT